MRINGGPGNSQRRAAKQAANTSDWGVRSRFPRKDLSANQYKWTFDRPAIICRAMALAGLTAEDIERKIAERTAARKAKDFARADAIRDELRAKGVELMDGSGGTTWKVVG